MQTAGWTRSLFIWETGREELYLIQMWYQVKGLGGSWRGRASVSMREQQGTPKGESRFGLEKGTDQHQESHMENGGAESGQEPQLQLCSICGSYTKPARSPPYLWLSSNNWRIFSTNNHRVLFLFPQSYGTGQGIQIWDYPLRY